MDRSDASALADLQMHWDEAYEIGLDGNVWWARFRGTYDDLRAHTGAELRELIRADYAYRQRTSPPRSAAGATGAQADDGQACPPQAGTAARADDAPADDEDTDDYADAYETGMSADESAPGHRPLAVPGQPGFAGLRGERMSI